jgi:hypothetical protein
MSRRIQPPWDYLHDASVPSLESYELSRLNHAANLRREIAALLDQWIEDSTQALLARWVREDRALPRGGPPAIESPQPQLPFDEAPSPAPPRRSERAMKLSRRTARSSSN